MRIFAAIVASFFASPVAVVAQDLDAGGAAYLAGDYAEALDELRPLAEQGDVEAQVLIAVMYANGGGVPQNHAEAARWFRLAAKQGSAGAQTNLGLMYRQGLGVPQDYVEAYLWLNIAAAQYFFYAAFSRDQVAKLMTADQIAEAQRRGIRCMVSDYTDCD